MGQQSAISTATNLRVCECGADLFAAGVDEILLQCHQVEPAQDEDIEARSQHQAQDQVQGINVADLCAAGEHNLLSKAQVVLVDNLQEHRVSTSVSIEVEQDANGNVVVLIIIDDDDKTTANEAAPPPWCLPWRMKLRS